MDIDKYKKFKEGKKEKSIRQEKYVAKRYGGRTTIASGATPADKADVRIDKVRVECKRTNGKQIAVKKEYLEKLERECLAHEIPVLNIQIEDSNWYLVRPSEFDYIMQKIKEE